MSFLIASLLPFAVCLTLIAGTSALWWSGLRAPWLFIVVGFLALLGVHRVAQAAFDAVRAFSGGGQYLEFRPSAESVKLAESLLMGQALATSAVVLVLGLPVLLWLKRTLAMTP